MEGKRREAHGVTSTEGTVEKLGFRMTAVLPFQILRKVPFPSQSHFFHGSQRRLLGRKRSRLRMERLQDLQVLRQDRELRQNLERFFLCGYRVENRANGWCRSTCHQMVERTKSGIFLKHSRIYCKWMQAQYPYHTHNAHPTKISLCQLHCLFTVPKEKANPPSTKFFRNKALHRQRMMK